MKRRKWTNEQKFKIVLSGLQSNCSVAELCNRHEIQQSQYYDWRDKRQRYFKLMIQANGKSR